MHLDHHFNAVNGSDDIDVVRFVVTVLGVALCTKEGARVRLSDETDR